MPLIKISIVEDDEEIADGMSRILNGTPGFRCCSTHPTGEDALEKLPFSEVDVVLIDLSLPGIKGSECIRRLRNRSKKLLFMVLTIHEDADRIFESLRAGASGYVLKRTPPAIILESIAELVAGGAPMSPGVARKVAQFFHNRPVDEDELGSLTDREREILHHLAQGQSDKEIAKKLIISPHTVRNHIKSIYDKLQVDSRTKAATKYLGR